MEITTVGELLHWSYANLVMTHSAVSAQAGGVTTRRRADMASWLGESPANEYLDNRQEAVAMGNQLEIPEAEALKLTAGERAAFARPLLASLDEDLAIEEAWAAELERRIADVENGTVRVIPIADALAQVRTGLK
jgi:putative addiction module component (TIGR02574 family)